MARALAEPRGTPQASASPPPSRGRRELLQKRRLQLVGQVGALPWEGVAVRLAAEMAIGGGLAIDRPVEAEMGADALGRQADELRDQLFERRLGHALGRGAVQVDIDRQRLGDADRVAALEDRKSTRLNSSH